MSTTVTIPLYEYKDFMKNEKIIYDYKRILDEKFEKRYNIKMEEYLENSKFDRLAHILFLYATIIGETIYFLIK